MRDAFCGLRPVETRLAATMLTDQVTTLLSLMKMIDAELRCSVWEGDDARAFADDWERLLKGDLDLAVKTMTSFANDLLDAVARQLRASC
jgi:hypothetical protein